MTTKKKFAVAWTKNYTAHGEEIIEAKSRVEAEFIMDERIGDLTGSMQYHPDNNYIEAFELK